VSPLPGLQLQTPLDQVLALGAQLRRELRQLAPIDVLVTVEGNVAPHHVEEQDAEGPDGGQIGMVAGATDPLQRQVHPW
jgi:hypothetical protein